MTCANAKRKPPQRVPDPTLEEINQRCEEIRERWSEQVMASRLAGVRIPWEMPVIECDPNIIAMTYLLDDDS